MKTILAVSSVALAFAGLMNAQIGRTFDVATAAADPQRTNFEKSDTKFTKDDVKDFKLVVKDKLVTEKKASTYLTAPVLIGTLVGYRGFKELAFVANPTGDLWAIDVDLDRLYWQRHIDLPKTKAKGSATCPVDMIAEPAMEPGASFGGRRRKGVKAPSRQETFRQLFAPRTLYVLAADGKLYRLDTSTGKDMSPPVDVMPAGGKVGNLNAAQGVIYAATSEGCGGAPNAVWSIDVSGDKPKVASFPSPEAEGFVGRNGVLLDADDQVIAQTSNTLQILSEKDLKLQQTFSGALGKVSPVAFTYKDKNLIVTLGNDGSLFLLDEKSLNLAVSQTSPIGSKIAGLSTWETGEGDRWVLATTDSGVVAFKLGEQEGKLVLTKGWTSHALTNPETAVIANGVVFALSAGESGKKGKLTGHATLYAFDGDTGKEIYSTGDQVTAPANLSGITMANGRVLFSTTDGTLWGFGYHLDH